MYENEDAVKKAVLLLVEPDADRREVLSRFLAEEGYVLHRTGDAQKALELFYDHMHELDLILLSTELKNPGSLEVMGEIRRTCGVPVIACDVTRNDKKELEYFGRGADDYLARDAEPLLVRAHIRALLRRSGVLRRTMECGPLLLEMDSRRVFLHKEQIRMTPREFDLLEFLMSNKGRVQTRETILLELWGYAYDGDIRTIDTLIKQLRKKLGNFGESIRTVYGVGYLFEVDE